MKVTLPITIMVITILHNFPLHHGNCQVLDIPLKDPDVRYINSTFLFRYKWDLHPILNYVHVQTTVSLSNLPARVYGISNIGRDYKEYIELDRAQKTLFPNRSDNVAPRH